MDVEPFAAPLPHEPIFTKANMGGFDRTGLDAYLRRRGVHTVYGCGFTTDVCVLMTLYEVEMKKKEGPGELRGRGAGEGGKEEVLIFFALTLIYINKKRRSCEAFARTWSLIALAHARSSSTHRRWPTIAGCGGELLCLMMSWLLQLLVAVQSCEKI